MGKTIKWLNRLSFKKTSTDSEDISPKIAQSPDADVAEFHQEFAQFGAGGFWAVELAFQRVEGVTKTEVGYSQGFLHNPIYRDVCEGDTGHVEVVRVQFDPKVCSYNTLVEVFWACHDPTLLNRQGQVVGTQYRSGIYCYNEEQEKLANESKENQQKAYGGGIVKEILPAKKFYRAETFHHQYLAKGGRFGFSQSAAKGCKDRIRCYG